MESGTIRRGFCRREVLGQTGMTGNDNNDDDDDDDET